MRRLKDVLKEYVSSGESAKNIVCNLLNLNFMQMCEWMDKSIPDEIYRFDDFKLDVIRRLTYEWDITCMDGVDPSSDEYRKPDPAVADFQWAKKLKLIHVFRIIEDTLERSTWWSDPEGMYKVIYVSLVVPISFAKGNVIQYDISEFNKGIEVDGKSISYKDNIIGMSKTWTSINTLFI